MPQRLLQTTRAESFDLRTLNSMMMRVRENPERNDAVTRGIVQRIVALREYCELVGYGARPAAEQADPNAAARKRPSNPPQKKAPGFRPPAGGANGAKTNGTGRHRATR